mmetsp:Transcript_4640/g.9656  ORF Transcript_4640/g.9656 Transcript_4640/m.9656 type:complete len:82 (-) Transcript_4640:99-344(-)
MAGWVSLARGVSLSREDDWYSRWDGGARPALVVAGSGGAGGEAKPETTKEGPRENIASVARDIMPWASFILAGWVAYAVKC